MSEALDDYLAKRGAALSAEREMKVCVGLINAASDNLGEANRPKNHVPNWRNIYHRDLLPAKGSQGYSARTLKDWPTVEEVLQKMNTYRAAIDAAEEAFNKLAPHEKEGVLPPP